LERRRLVAVSLTLSDEQYEALVAALAVGHPNKNVNKHKNELISTLPKPLSKKVKPLREVISDSSLLQKTTDADELIQKLIVMDTAKQASKYTGRSVIIMLTDMFKKDPNLAKDARDLVFNKFASYKFPGQLIKHLLAEALVDAGFANDAMFRDYKSKIMGRYPGDETSRIFEKIISSDKKYSKDVKLLTQLGCQNNRRVAMIAVSAADDKILPYLVSITNKMAREAVKKRMNA
jgi:hypothetical protein